MNDKNKLKSFLITFVTMFVFWVVLSNIFDLIHISLGIISCLIVAYVSHDLFPTVEKLSSFPKKAFNFVKYFFWLLKEIILANIDVAKIVLDPNLPISPRIIEYESELNKDISKTTLGNSITLTPGTLTLDIDKENKYYIHCLTEHHATGFKEGDMEENVQKVFEGGEK